MRVQTDQFNTGLLNQIGSTLEIIFITIPVTLIFIGVGAAIFFWASKKGQFDDLDSPAHRILFDDDIAPNSHKNVQPNKQQEDLSKNE